MAAIYCRHTVRFAAHELAGVSSVTEPILVGAIAAVAALLGSLIGSVPLILQHRIRLRELREQRTVRVHAQTIELLKTYSERIKLLGSGPGAYSTYDPPLFLYWTFYRALQAVEDGSERLPPEIEELIKQDLRYIGRDPKNYGFHSEADNED